MDTIEPIRFVLAFVFVLGLIGVMSMGLKRYMKAKGMTTDSVLGSRLQVVETRYLDGRRRLVLVKHDNTEHLLLLADGRETVIETNIITDKP